MTGKIIRRSVRTGRRQRPFFMRCGPTLVRPCGVTDDTPSDFPVVPWTHGACRHPNHLKSVCYRPFSRSRVFHARRTPYSTYTLPTRRVLAPVGEMALTTARRGLLAHERAHPPLTRRSLPCAVRHLRVTDGHKATNGAHELGRGRLWWYLFPRPRQG